jgi:hypothetical protein
MTPSARRRAVGLCLASLVVTIGCGAYGGPDPDDPHQRSGAIETGSLDDWSIVGRSQSIEPGSLMLDSVSIVRPGYVLVFAESDHDVGELLGVSRLLEPGSLHDVEVPFGDHSTAGVDAVFAVLHGEDNGDRTFDGVDVDREISDKTGVPLVRLPVRH